MLHYNFNFEKTLQASSLVLQALGGPTEYMRLLKILYITDRELLAESGFPLTGDQPYAMKYGPVLSNLYDVIRGRGDPQHVAVWDKHIERHQYVIQLKTEAGDGLLNDEEVAKISDVTERYAEVDVFDLSEATHDFPEWSNVFDPRNPNSSYQMKWEAALVSQGKEQLIPSVESELETFRRVEDAWAQARRVTEAG